MKIKYYLIPMEKAVVFQIIWMDERFRNTKSTFTSVNKLTIKSANYLELYKDGVYLLGTENEKDDPISIEYFDDNEERDAYISRVHSALEDWGKNWEGWKKNIDDNHRYLYEV